MNELRLEIVFTNMTDKHLLYWIFRASSEHYSLRENALAVADLFEDDFKAVDAPEWVWPAFQQKVAEYYRLYRR